MPENLRFKEMKLKHSDIQARKRSDMTAILWREKRETPILMDIHKALAEGNFCNVRGSTMKPIIVANKTVTWVMWVRQKDGKQQVHKPSHMQVDEEIILPSVRPGYSEEFHSSVFM
jgi:hypothetical protein